MKSNKRAIFINKIDDWDKRIIVKYNGIGGKNFTYFLKCVSFFGRETLWIFLMAFYLFLFYDPYSLSYIGATFLCGVLIVLSIKNAVKRERPFETLKELRVLERHPTSRSFPSWHAYNVASQGILMGFLLDSSWISLLLESIWIALILLVAFSRIQLGVHYPSDVIIGSILGVFGGIITFFLVGPFSHSIISYLEQFAIHEIEYRSINSMLREAWYLLLCFVVFGLIFLSATYKRLKEVVKKNRH